MFSWKTTTKPIIALAPMDGYTDSAFRQLIKSIEKQVICFTEFISSDHLAIKPKDVNRVLQITQKEQPVIVQLFGKIPEHFAKAAQVLENFGAAGIDINMGCPAKKVISSMHGAYLIKNIDLGCTIIHAVKKAVKIPVSVKTRLGWDDDKNLIPFVQKLQNAGIDAITIHGRTYKQGFHGEADWESMYNLKKRISIPVIGNGDIKSGQDAREKLQNLDGVMIGRASFGNPWIFKEVAGFLQNKKEWTTDKVSMKKRIQIMKQHARLLVQSKGDKKGILESRKHMAAYIKGIPDAANFRNQLVRINSLEELDRILREIEH